MSEKYNILFIKNQFFKMNECRLVNKISHISFSFKPPGLLKPTIKSGQK